MKEWHGKFGHELKLESNTYVTISIDDEVCSTQVFLFPNQAREVAEYLLKLADEAEKSRIES